MSNSGSKAGGGPRDFESKSDDRDDSSSFPRSDSSSPTNVLSSWALIEFEDITVGKFIAGGGAGVIHEGEYKGERVALKALFDSRISEELKREFMNELLVMSRLDHSNIVQFKGACVTPPNMCFVMEMCDSNLDQMLHVERDPISDYDKIQMAIDIAQAMEYLHSLKPAVIHRDLKALNVLRSHDGVLKLCDFGLVANKISAAGTPGYMAPGKILLLVHIFKADSFFYDIHFNLIYIILFLFIIILCSVIILSFAMFVFISHISYLHFFVQSCFKISLLISPSTCTHLASYSGRSCPKSVRGPGSICWISKTK